MFAARKLKNIIRPRYYCRAFSNQQKVPVFDAEIAAAYNKMAENHKHPKGPWNMMAEIVAERIGSDSATVLDIATGPGQPAAMLAARLANAKVIATDCSEDMVKAAKEAHKNLDNMTVQLADAQDLSAFADNSIDVVTCCYGYMFPENKEKALQETLRVLKPDGMLVATTWDRVDILKICKDVMTSVLGFEPPPPPLNPMSLSEPGLFNKMLQDAGFKDVSQSTSTYPFNFGDEKNFQFKVGTLLLKDKIDEIGGEAWKTAEESFWTNIGKYTKINDDGAMIMPENTFRLSIAYKRT